MASGQFGDMGSSLLKQAQMMAKRVQDLAREIVDRYDGDTARLWTDGDPDGAEVLRRLRGVVAHEGFVIHPDKTRVLRRGRRQEVTGVVVNSKPGVARDALHRFRATLFQIEKDGPAGKRWGACKNVLASIRGFASYVRMVDAERGTPLLARVDAICAKYGGKPTPPGKSGSGTPSPAAGPGHASTGTRSAKAAPDAPTPAKTEMEAAPKGATAPAAPADGAPAAGDSSTGGGTPGGKKWWKVF